MSVQVSYKKQTLFFIILIFITLLITEGMVRYFDVVGTPSYCEFIHHELFMNYSSLEKNTFCKEYTTLEYDYSDAIRIHIPKEGKYININTDGFRGGEINFQPDVYKIFFLGGSTAFGFVSSGDNFTIPAFLEKKLNENGLNVNVINAGSFSFNSNDERYYFEKYIVHYSPNMVIMYDGWNDVVTFNNFNYEEFSNQTYYDNHMNHLPYLDNPIKSQIMTFLLAADYKTGIGVVEIVTRLIYGENYDEDVKKIDISPQEYLLKVENRLHENWSNVCRLGHTNDIKIINILQPILGSGNKTSFGIERFSTDSSNSPYLWSLKLNDTKYSPCTSVYDLRDAFDDIENRTIFLDEGHTTDFGNQIVANNIYEKILSTVLEDISK